MEGQGEVWGSPHSLCLSCWDPPDLLRTPTRCGLLPQLYLCTHTPLCP